MSEENITNKQPLIRYVNRQQMSWRAVDVEKLISEDHPARAIWALVGRLDLSSFYRVIESSVEEGGRPAFDPQLLISLWVYAYSQGIGSAREIARRCEYDPAFQWLTGLTEVNYHTLADFRVEKQQELDELFTQVLAALSKEGLITLEQVMQDGTKIKALASSRSYRHEGLFASIWNRRDSKWRRWAIPETTRPVRRQSKRRLVRDACNKSGWKVHSKSCRSCRHAGPEKRPSVRRG
jgi:transposase